MEMSFMEITMWGMVALVPPLWWYKGGKNHEREGMNYHPLCDSSFPNPGHQLSGNKWSENHILKNQFRESETNSLKLDNFEYPHNFYWKHISIFKKMFLKKAEIYVPRTALVESLVMLAPMKGGKTTTLYSWLAQPWYNRAIINEQKAGDFVSKFYNKRKDIILSYYDSRAHVWDILSEGLQIIEFYILNSLNSATGENANFFTNDAKKKYKEIARLTLDIEDVNEKWDFFIVELEKLFDEIEKKDNKAQKDVSSTMQQIIEPLKLTRFQLRNGKKSFTIREFFKKKHQSKLFMVNHDEYTVTLKPLFTAFTACVAMVHAGKPDNTDDITAYILDEYLSLQMNYDARLILHTKTRSKGSAVISAMQFLPEDKKVYDLLTSSAFGYMVFSIKNERTRQFVESQIGKWKYLVRKEINGQYQEQEKEHSIINWDEIDKLSKEYKHLSYIPESGSLYIGISDFQDFKIKHEPFIYDTLFDDFNRSENKEYLDKKSNIKKLKDAAEKYGKKKNDENDDKAS
ncbi:MAG: type IV secretion system DNA-binding domain-containing protein [Sulfurimonas sp.]|nr:type IV secretion system DNA-binding domain-containing protein [Sulfurimonas sp.]MDD3834467.1 type IV secretion system DNA-binding domain-containing protein [Sulfurimonas sp.]